MQNIIPPDVDSLELCLPNSWLGDDFGLSEETRCFIEKNTHFLDRVFSNIPAHITKLKLDNLSGLKSNLPRIISDNVLHLYYHAFYIGRLKIIAGLFSKLHPGIIEIDLSKLHFHLLTKDSLKILRCSLPFIKTVYVSAKSINNMSKAALDQFCEIFPNATYYELGDKYSYQEVVLRTPKITYLLNKPKRTMQLTHYACNLLLIQNKFSPCIIFQIISYLDLSDEINIKETILKISSLKTRDKFEKNNVDTEMLQTVLKETNPLRVPVALLPHYSNIEDMFFQINAYSYLLIGLGLAYLSFKLLTDKDYNELEMIIIWFNSCRLAFNALDTFWEIHNARGRFTFTEMQSLSPSPSFRQFEVYPSKNCSLTAIQNQATQLSNFSYSFFNHHSIKALGAEKPDIENQLDFVSKKLN